MNNENEKNSHMHDASMGHTCAHCNGHMCHHGGRHFLLRWILGIAILMITFSIGVKVGEFKRDFFGGGYRDSLYRHHMMMWGGANDYDYNYNYYNDGYGPGMMRTFRTYVATSTKSR